MRISQINGCNPYRLYNKNNNKQIISPVKTEQPAFNGNINTYLLLSNSRFKNLIGQGYRIFNSDVKVISPKGEEIDAIAFVKDGLNRGKRNIDIVLTDADCYALGEVSSFLNRIGFNGPKNVVTTAIRNYTRANKGEKLDFMEPTMETRSADTDGVYHHVGRELYSDLEKYIKKFHPNIKLFLANISTNESWNFHRACGFTLDINGNNIPKIDGCKTPLPDSSDLYRVIK